MDVLAYPDRACKQLQEIGTDNLSCQHTDNRIRHGPCQMRNIKRTETFYDWQCNHHNEQNCGNHIGDIRHLFDFLFIFAGKFIEQHTLNDMKIPRKFYVFALCGLIVSAPLLTCSCSQNKRVTGVSEFKGKKSHVIGKYKVKSNNKYQKKKK